MADEGQIGELGLVSRLEMANVALLPCSQDSDERSERSNQTRVSLHGRSPATPGSLDATRLNLTT